LPVLILGVGNRDRGDDGVGPLAAEKLALDPVLKRLGVEARSHSGEGASLMDLWRGHDRVIVIDAMKSGARLGHVLRFDAAARRLEPGTFRYSSHLFSLAEAVEMARVLGQLPKEMIVFGIEGRKFGFGAALSPSVAKALVRVVAEVRDFVLQGAAHA